MQIKVKGLKLSVSKEEVNDYEVRSFQGDTFVIDRLDQVEEACEYLRQHKYLGFDTETKPSFKKGVINNVALLQLSTGGRVYLFRINKIGLPKAVRDILSSKSIFKSGVAIKDDIRILQKVANFEPNGFVELQEYVKRFGIESFSLKKLTVIALGFRISKGERLSNWEAEPLTSKMQRYAATDAWVSLLIYINLLDIELRSEGK